ncbi:hypothetical protein [Candidatus Blastococcus massiliensis]|uniref:hypothetical protein n=1 Tax=Candidatus Blastococcus massiliensis TaxID=1470358 RepID=UPI0004B95A79|nr:hypothetical protein [Candidatus Blastococcus massiliensis]
MRRLVRGAALALLVLGTATACGRDDAPRASQFLAVAEVLTTPAADSDGAVFSVALRNDGPEPVTVSEVVVEADDGLAIEVLGASSCRRGCAGAMGWGDAEPMLADSIEWPDGFVVPPEADVMAGRADVVKVVMHVSPADAAARAHLGSGCLFVRELAVRIDDGPPVSLGNRYADFVVALDRPDAGEPGVPAGCRGEARPTG